VDNEKVVGTEPWPRHPVSEGKLCIKGWNAHQFIHSQERLRKPLLKKNGAFVEVAWAEALEVIAQEFRIARENFEADCLGVVSSAKCTNEENYLIQKFARVVLGTNNIDHCARL
jgi:formate dehydrogenase major subunit